MENPQRQFEQLIQKSSREAGQSLEVKNIALQALGTLRTAYPNRVDDADLLSLATGFAEKLEHAAPNADLNALRNVVVKAAHDYFNSYRLDTTNTKVVSDAKNMGDYFESIFDRYLADSA